MLKKDNNTADEDSDSESKGIDIVLIHTNPGCLNGSINEEEQTKLEVIKKVRDVFENRLEKEGFLIKEYVHENTIYKTLHCDLKRLHIEAEITNLEMPLERKPITAEEPSNSCSRFIFNNSCSRFISNKFVTDNGDVDYISARFMVEKKELFENHNHPTKFFRQAIRTLLVDHILININIKEDDNFDANEYKDTTKSMMLKSDLQKLNTTKSMGLKSDLQKLNFPCMKKLNVYTDSLILHDASELSKIMEDGIHTNEDMEKLGIQETEIDQRKVLHEQWTAFFKFQPLTKIRNYFGEKIAFYFAWSGFLITSLWFPMILGLAIFIYGIVNSARESASSGTANATAVTNILTVVKLACDNDATPYYALIICLWGTIFLKLWRRKTATLAYEWDVDEFKATEPDRPEFYGTEQRRDPVTEETGDWHYPMKKRLLKYAFSALTLAFMLCLVLGSVVSVIIYRVITSVDYCPNVTPQACVLLTTVISSLLNTISILILDKLYDFLARKLTDWENHRTQTMYDDALILKLFPFQFVNNYTTCFYIAFVRGNLGKDGIVGKGPLYQDDCEPNGNCMLELSFQILILMITKPLPKLFVDVLLPLLKRARRKRRQSFCDRKVNEMEEKLQKEELKPSLGDFTMGEYTEKIIQYGFLMLFAASLPLAPLIALLTNFVDIRVDARRMLWWYRRPLAIIAQDIGTWYVILQFVNVCSVVSNGFLVGFTSSWGRSYSPYIRLWIFLGFEHIVFVLKFVLAYIIPDVPSKVQLDSRKNLHFATAEMSDCLRKLHFATAEMGKGSLDRSSEQKRRHHVDEGNPFEDEVKKKHHDIHDDEQHPPYKDLLISQSEPQVQTPGNYEMSERL